MILLLAVLLAQVGAGPIRFGPQAPLPPEWVQPGSGSRAPFINVRAAPYYAVGDGVADDTAAFNSAITALAPGGMLFVPKGNYIVTSTLTIPVLKSIRMSGAGYETAIGGAGITILKIQADYTTVENLRIYESGAGSASTIAILIDNGATGVSNWALRSVTLANDTGTKLGIGLKTNFGLEGRIVESLIYGWNKGYQANRNAVNQGSNANFFSGTTLRINNTGAEIAADGATDTYFSGCTIEGNTTGLATIASTSPVGIELVGTHFENLAGQTNVSLPYGKLMSQGCNYSNVAASQDVVMSGTATFVSYGDQFFDGITNNGTGTATIRDPLSTSTNAGTGPIVTSLSTSMIGTNATSTPFQLSGFQSFDVRQSFVRGDGNSFVFNIPNGASTAFQDAAGTKNLFVVNTTGLGNDTAGFKHKRGTAGCATGAAAGAACTTTVTWTTAFADANYTASCLGNAVTSGVPLMGGITAKAAASVTFQTVAGTAAAAQFTNIECQAEHD